MPDGLTHIAGGYIFGKSWLKHGQLSLFLLGCLIPDILLRGGRLLFAWSPEKDFLELYLAPLHTPVTGIFVCLALAQIFHAEIRKRAFLLLYAGCFCHFILDLFQRTINGFGFSVEPLDGYHWLFPLTWFDFQLGIFWPEDSSYGLLFLIPAAMFLFYYRRNDR